MVELTSKERGLARHALGLDSPNSGGVAYRNRFMCGEGSENAHAWRALADRGLALISSDAGVGTVWAHCGSALANAVLNDGESIDREETEVLANIDLAINASRSN